MCGSGVVFCSCEVGVGVMVVCLVLGVLVLRALGGCTRGGSVYESVGSVVGGGDVACVMGWVMVCGFCGEG